MSKIDGVYESFSVRRHGLPVNEGEQLSLSVRKISGGMDLAKIPYQLEDGKILFDAKDGKDALAKVRKALKADGKYKIVDSKGGHFGSYELKDVLTKSTTGGFNVVVDRKTNKYCVYTPGGTGYSGQD